MTNYAHVHRDEDGKIERRLGVRSSNALATLLSVRTRVLAALRAYLFVRLTDHSCRSGC